MKSHSLYLFASFLLAGSACAAEPAKTDTVRTQIQAEQAQKQALADALWRYLAAEPARRRQLDAAGDRLYSLAFQDGKAPEGLPDASSLGLTPWQAALAPLRSLGLPAATAASLKTLDDALKGAAGALGAIPTVGTDAPPKRRIERQQAILAAASALLSLKQQAASLDARLEEAARSAASGAHLLASQSLMQSAPIKGDKR